VVTGVIKTSNKQMNIQLCLLLHFLMSLILIQESNWRYFCLERSELETVNDWYE